MSESGPDSRLPSDLPPQTLELAIAGMSCAACSARLEKMLNRLPGVDAVVNLATERATVRYLPGVVAPALLIATVERAGFTGRLADDRSQADEKARKRASERAELRRFWISAALTLPLTAQMLSMFDADVHAHQDVLPRWLQLLLATPVQFWIGWRFYDGAWKALRGGGQHGRAGRARHQHGLRLQPRRHAVATCPPACLFRGLGGGDHAGAARQDARGARQGQDHEAIEALAPAAENGARRARRATARHRRAGGC
jgi:copper chaperone CopZ